MPNGTSSLASSNAASFAKSKVEARFPPRSRALGPALDKVRRRRGARVTDTVTGVRRQRRWLPWAGGLIGAVTLAWLLRRFDLDRFLSVLAGADMLFLALVPLAIMGEQLVRAWKWRQLLFPIRSIGTVPLFGTIMAGYLLGMLVPFGFG